MTDPGIIVDRCFNVFVERLQLVPDFKLPHQRFTHAGTLAPDCELFAVSIPPTGIYQGLPGQARRGYVSETGGLITWSMDIAVTLLRDVPLIDNAGRIPSGPDLTAASQRATADAKALTDVFNGAINDGALVDDCTLQAFGGVIFDGPQGGMLATILNWSVSL